MFVLLRKLNPMKKGLVMTCKAACLLVMGMLVSCIKNDIPYPYIEGVIQAIEVKGIVGDAKIDKQRHAVEVVVDEDTDLKAIVVTKLVANSEAKIYPDADACANVLQFPDYSFTSLYDLPANANTTLDCSAPVTILLRTYQDYMWTLKVRRQVDRSVSVDHQVGEPQIDELTHTVIVYVDKKSCTLEDINILELNLEGDRAKALPDPSTVKDFTRPRTFKFYRNDKLVGTWTVDVQFTEQTSSTGSVDAWAKKATLNGGMRSGATPTVEYKKASESTWTRVDAADVKITSATSFTTELHGLSDGTDYEWHVIVDGVTGQTAKFTTEKIVEVPNLNFDTWTMKGKNWYANSVPDNYDDPDAFWASGNEGVTSTLAGGKDATTVPVDGSDAYKGKAARLTSLTGVALVGAAAGNLFIGKYKTNLSNPSSSPQFGRPFTGARPLKMAGYYKYISMPITHEGTVPGNLTMDRGHIYIKIWDSAGNLFGYGEQVITETVKEYQHFEFDIKYTDLTAKPAMMTIVATSSQYGGEFSGARVCGQVGAGSTLWVDEFELLYE